MSVAWTKEQQQVIDSRNQNLLVSAAAGSGKTAVLVERILSLILDEEKKIDVDRLLITTFTKAAAGEMKERIGKAINERLQVQPENEWLQRQEALLPRAQITTIHGFCLYVIRNYFHTIGLNPNFRIADQGEMGLLKQDVAEEILEEAFMQRSAEFIKFAESYGSGTRGNGLEEMILELYEYAIANPRPQAWLQSCAKKYELPEDATWNDFSESNLIFEELKITVSDAMKQMLEALRLVKLPDGPKPYEEVLCLDIAFLQDLLDAKTMEQFEELLTEHTYKRLPSKRSKAMAEVDEELCEKITNLRNGMKDSLKNISQQYFQVPSEVLFEQLRETAGNVHCYVELTLAFMERLKEKKRRKNILDFDDQEHLALQILTREEDGKLVPSEVADIFCDYYAEIMVDEYQDSNLVQEAILESISGGRRGKHNRFMVGDVKQSIYRFRQAEPRLFLEKYQRYSKEEDGRKIDLHQNFRSREEVLDSVNEVFEKIMFPELGGISYDETAALKKGAAYPQKAGTNTEFLVLAQEEWEKLRYEISWTKAEAEAHLIAVKIKKLLDEEQVTENGKLRPIRLGDIVILLRAMKGWSETFVKVLQEEGIPARAQSREGYFQTMEIETLLAYLRVLDNPTQEIPLAAALHSSLGGFSSEELAKIKSAHKELSFAKACRQYVEDGEEGVIKERLKAFFETVDHYRKRASYTSIHELLWEIVSETGYLDTIRALAGGEQRLANVEMLLQKAQDYEKISYHGLFHFVRYIEKLQKYQIDYGEADLSGMQEQTVQIMSIHHSKGLEFPVVFVAGMGRGFNKQDSRRKMIFHHSYGIGLDYVDLEKRMKQPTLLKELIRRENALESVAEELRVLYVAMTRAREKLILTGMIKEGQGKLPTFKNRLLLSQVSGASCYLVWLLSAKNPHQSSIEEQWISLADILKDSISNRVKEFLNREELEKRLVFKAKDKDLQQQFEHRLSWNYAWNFEQRAKQKYTVSELKKMRMVEADELVEELYPEEIVATVPQFIEKSEKKVGAAKGTIYHTIMEQVDFFGMTKLSQIEEAFRHLVAQGCLQEEDLQAVWPKDFLIYAKSELAKRMQRAKEQGCLFKEQPFVIGIPGNEIEESNGEELVLVQGIIDAFFYEGEEIVLVDYKTDHCYEEEELIRRYRQQLDYYQRALEMTSGKKVKERLIYSFAMKKTISV